MLGVKERVRGPTKKKEIWNLVSDEKVLVTFNELCQPIGHEGNELTNFLETLVRMPQHIGIHYSEWRKVPKEKKDDLWSIVKEKFSFQSDHSEKNIKEWITSDMSTKWKCWKYELKKRSYDSTMTINEIVASQTNDKVETGQFRTLMESWFTEEKLADIKAIGDSSSIDQETTNNSDWTNDDLSKVKGPERRGLVLSTEDKSGVNDIPINISDVNHHHTSGNKSAVRDTVNKSGTSRFNTSVSIGKKSCPKMLGIPLTNTVNKSVASRLNTSVDSKANVFAKWNAVYDAYNEVAYLMLELKSMFGKQAGVERFYLIQTFHTCKQKEVKKVGAYVLEIKDYVEQLECLGYVLPQDLSVGLILNSFTSDFTGFVRNYNMHNMGKKIGEIHALLIEYEKGLLEDTTDLNSRIYTLWEADTRKEMTSG
uniref:Zinc finger, CCHC-type n=1 Tax=Tanacetum cinerariifolium TaxID=118510 RepID=A0A6L2LSQ4_TANCI|nr:hypothetical protein [Tanacetum cinerariifolium]